MSCACSGGACAIASVTGHRNITSPSMLRHLNACQKAVVSPISPPLSLRCPVEPQEKVVCGAACRQDTGHGCPDERHLVPALPVRMKVLWPHPFGAMRDMREAGSMMVWLVQRASVARQLSLSIRLD